ncbi:MAG: hypothetical protein HYZ42_14905 [Bacteroidetes bacterium]|nr:hypothetical protein [Bacteroidota bacterium]
MEFHPRINLKNPVLLENRIILGSFPTWQFTAAKCNEEALEKEMLITKKGEISFYYGSWRNQFWSWYRQYVDQLIVPDDLPSIKKSLDANLIGITDVIYCCKRHGRSALDKHLYERSYNHNFFRVPNKGEVIKILCTSKGVMNEMLLINSFFKVFPELKTNENESKKFQENLLKTIDGDPNIIKSPFFTFLEFGNGGRIEVLSTPSPGSPYRRLIDFGLTDASANEYLQKYLTQVFKWFLA